MRWARYEKDGIHYGIVEGDRVVEIDTSPFDTWSRTSRTHALDAVRLLIPVVPTTFYCVGFNYAAHAAAFNKSVQGIPTQPDVGYRANSALIAPGEAIVIPADSAGVQYEGELAVVIGKTGKHVSEAEALSLVLGYTIGNDVSERVWQASDATLWRAKNADTFKPMGPWIETEVDLPSLVTRVRVNGEQTTEFRTNEMVFGVATYISTISRYITLRPGDVIWMGTEGSSVNLQHGDVVEIEIDQIGTLRNPVVAERMIS
ncbi:MAG: 2-keto-4-pentenoate hydratase [Rhodospirillales bacterium]|nr:2-keto-4-pentenoate hydratase [Rhodospirillales bacterium]